MKYLPTPELTDYLFVPAPMPNLFPQDVGHHIQKIYKTIHEVNYFPLDAQLDGLITVPIRPTIYTKGID